MLVPHLPLPSVLYLDLSLSLSLSLVQIFTDKNYLRKILEVINSCGCLLEGEGLLSTIGPVNLSRTTTDSTLLDYPKSQSDPGDSQDEEEGQQGPELPPTDDGDKHKFLLKIRDCLGLLRELFFMSRQSIPLDQRSPPLVLSPLPVIRLIHLFLSQNRTLCEEP
jgi:hypothetical protein